MEEFKKAFKKSKTFYELSESRKIGYVQDGNELLVSVGGIIPLGIRKNNNGFQIYVIQTDHESDQTNKIPLETIKI